MPTTGLEDVVATQQDICYIGPEGDLIYRGYHVDELANNNATCEEVAYLLWYDRLPTQSELDDFTARLTAARQPDPATLVPNLPSTAHPMAVCRTGVSRLGLFDAPQDTFEAEACIARALNIMANLPALMAAFARQRRHQMPVPPRNDLGHVANFLWMLHGKEPTPEAVAALNLYFVMVAENDLTASTFACRVAASTWADVYAALVSGIATFGGDAHGGAVQRVLKQFQDIGTVENVEPWLEAAQKAKRRLMGIGHRVYKTIDPRTPHLRERVRALAGQSEHRLWFDIADRVAEVTGQQPFFQQRNLYPNVDYYAAPLLYMLGLQPDMNTTVFTMGRISGWATHIMAQYANNRLIRPRTEYTGPRDLRWVPITARG